jgi:hypothetical protein
VRTGTDGSDGSVNSPSPASKSTYSVAYRYVGCKVPCFRGGRGQFFTIWPGVDASQVTRIITNPRILYFESRLPVVVTKCWATERQKGLSLRTFTFLIFPR